MKSTGRAQEILTASIEKERQNIGLFQECLIYCPLTGELFWKKARGTMAAGSRAGYVTAEGYLQVQVGGRLYLGHRIAWAIHNSAPAENLIDHINGIKSDNRLANLRVVTPEENQQSIFASFSGAKVRFRGVIPKNSGFQAAIRVGGRQVYLGLYPTAELASAAYLSAKAEFHPASNTAKPFLL